MYYILFYKTIENYVKKRVPYREEHLAYARKAWERGELILAGALADPPDSAVLIFKGEEPSVAQEFARKDPYVTNGLITEWTVRPWTLALISLVFTLEAAAAQEITFESPDYGKIEKEIKKRSSGFFYETLFDRYVLGDSTLTLEEKRHVYYGYSFQDKYAPYETSEYSDSVRLYLQKDTLSDSDLESVVRFSELLLKENPFDMRALNYLAFSCHSLKNEPKAVLCFNKLTTIMDAIMSSGDGISEETAFSVIYVSHEYDLLNALDFSFGGKQMLTKNGFDYLTLEPNEYGIDGFYFEISRCLATLDKMFK
jgi:uncharacterized protein YciI